MVVSSLVAMTLAAEPSTSRPTSSSFIPLSLETTVASVRMEDEGVKDAFELVEDEDREGFAFNFFGDDNEVFAAGLGALLQERQEFVGAGDFLIGDQDEGLLKDGFLAVGVGDKEG